MTVHLTEDDVERIAQSAITAELAAPERRGPLLGRLDAAFRAALPRHPRPSDQLRSDLSALARHPDRRALDGWLIEARQLAAATHPVEAHLFDRYRFTRHGVLVGGGKPPPTWAKSALLTADRVLRDGLGHGRAVNHVVRREGVESDLILDLVEHYGDGPAAELLWIHLAGEIFAKRGTPRLVMADRGGLELPGLAALVANARAETRVVVIDTGEEPGPDDLAAITGLDWGDAALIAVGPQASDLLAAALSDPGRRTGADLAAALPATIATRHSGSVVADRDGDAVAIVADPHQAAIVEYLEGLRSRCRAVPVERQATGLECLGEVYVPLHTDSPTDRRLEQTPRAARNRAAHGGRDEEPPRSLHDRVAEHRHVFIVGEPGSGKTTTLRQLCEMLCDAHLDPDGSAPPAWVPERPLPVWLDLLDIPPDLPRSASALLGWGFEKLVRRTNAEPLGPEVARDALRERRLVLILDGLDEVAHPQHRLEWARAIADLARVQAADARVWVSCREAARAAGADPGEPLTRVALRPFDRAQRDEVIHRWLAARIDDPERAGAEAGALAADLERHPRVDAETGSPLLLALVCLLHFDKRRLPDSRVELYGNLVDLLLRNRDRQVDPGIDDLDIHHRRAVLTDLAVEWWARVGSQHGLEEPSSGDVRRPQGIGHDDCVGIIDGGLARVRLDLGAEPAERYRRAKALVEFFDLRTSLLRWTATDAGGQKQLGFAHRTFAEYLVACRIGERAQARAQTLTMTAARDPNWREVFTLFAAQTVQVDGADPSAAWRWIEQLVGWARDATQPPPDRAAYARLAAECLEPCRDRAPPAETIAAVDDLQDLMLDADASAGFPAVHRAAYWHAIGEANRLVGPEEPIRWVAIPAGEFWRGASPGDASAFDDEKPGGMLHLPGYHIHRWPVLVQEYDRFVEADGYGRSNRPPWWSVAGWRWRQAGDISHPAAWSTQRRGRPAHPVVGVSHHEAMAYARWLTVVGEGPHGAEGEADLPMEAEWERAARGGGSASKRRRYPWGWDDDPERRNGAGSGLGGTSAIGVFPQGRSPDGLWAMSGNVYEWCRDHGLKPYGQEHGRPSATVPGSPSRAVRGGGWGNHPQFLRVSCRGVVEAEDRLGVLGFRCVWRFPPRSLGS